MQVLAAAVEDTDKSLRELDSDEFYPFLEGAGEKLVIVDFYTDWCFLLTIPLSLLALAHLPDQSYEICESLIKSACHLERPYQQSFHHQTDLRLLSHLKWQEYCIRVFAENLQLCIGVAPARSCFPCWRTWHKNCQAKQRL